MTNWRFISTVILTIIAIGLLGWNFINTSIFISLGAIIVASGGQLINLESANLTTKDKILLGIACVIIIISAVLFIIHFH